MTTERTALVGCAEKACAACPWRISNHGRRHPGGWYSKANRRRLWNGLRTGDAPGMTCHPTDPDNQPVRDGIETRECAGAMLLLARELGALNAACAEADDGRGFARYRKGRSYPLTIGGAIELANRLMFGGTPLDGRPSIAGLTLAEDSDIATGLA